MRRLAAVAVARIKTLAGAGFDNPEALATDGRDVWVLDDICDFCSVTEIDASDGNVVRVLSGGRYDFGVPNAVAADGRHVWVLDGLVNTVSELDAAPGALVGRISLSVAGNPYGEPETIIRDGPHLWVTDGWNSQDTAGSVIELTTAS